MDNKDEYKPIGSDESWKGEHLIRGIKPERTLGGGHYNLHGIKKAKGRPKKRVKK